MKHILRSNMKKINFNKVKKETIKKEIESIQNNKNKIAEKLAVKKEETILENNPIINE